MNSFVFDIVLKEEDICNLEKERKILLSGVDQGKKYVFYGKRNTGKTSLVESVVIPYFVKKKSSFALYVDLLGVKDEQDVLKRLARAFEIAFGQAFASKSMFQKMVEVIKGIRPSIQLDNSGNFTLGISESTSNHLPTLSQIFEQIRKLEKNGVKILLVFDEFQDISFLNGFDAIIRNELQHLSKSTSVIVLGSKKHLLTKLFTSSSSALFNWGEPIEIGPINYEIYHKYMQERFKAHNILVEINVAKYIQDLMNRTPEAVNMLCSALIDLTSDVIEKTNHNKKNNYVITMQDVDKALQKLIAARKGKYSEYLSHYTSNQQSVLTTLAKEKEIISPTGKDFLRKTNVSKAAVSKIITKFLDEAILYYTDGHYEFSDPLLRNYLRTYC